MSSTVAMSPLSRLVARNVVRSRTLTPAIRAYKADPQHPKKEQQQQHQAKKEQHHDEGAALQKAPAPSAPSLARRPLSMMMSPLMGGDSLEAFFPPSAVSMLRAMDHMFARDPFFGDFFAPAAPASRAASAAVAPAAAAPAAAPALLPLDISESADGKSYLIKADLPGVDKSDVKVEVSPDGQFLSISGSRSEERRFGGGEQEEGQAKEGAAAAAAQQARPLRVERRWSSWSRTLALSPDVDAEGVKASLKDGVLQVTLPKAAPPEEAPAPAPKVVDVE